MFDWVDIYDWYNCLYLQASLFIRGAIKIWSSSRLAQIIKGKEVNTTGNLTVGQILGYVNQMMVDWGVMPYIQALMILLAVIGGIVLVRRLWLGS